MYRRNSSQLTVLLCGLAGLFLIPMVSCTRLKTEGLKPFEILLDWQAEPTYFGIYYAKHLGLFQKLGLDVSIIQSWGANQAVASVAAGRYSIGTASGGATVLGFNNSPDVASMAVLYPRIPSVIYGLATTGIRKPQDLVGKKIGIYPGSITSNEFDAFLKVNQIDRQQLEIVSLSGPDIPLLKAKQVDAVLHYHEMSPVSVALDPTAEMVDGKRAFEIKLSEHGVQGYGLNIITNRRFLREDTQLARSIVQAMLEGYKVGCESPDEAIKSFLTIFPDRDEVSVREGWRRVCELINGNYGNQDEAGWEETISLYRDLGLLNSSVTPKEILP